MTTSPAPYDLPPEVEEALWAQRFAEAQLYAPLSDVSWEARECETGIDAAITRRAIHDMNRSELLAEWERAVEQSARWEGAQLRLLAAALDLGLRDGTEGRDAEMSVREVAAELACAAALPDRSIQRRMADAATMRDHFPATLHALTQGTLSRGHAQGILDEGVRLPLELRAEYEQLVLERSPSLSVGRLRAVAAAIAEQLDPVTMADRHGRARDGRRVELQDLQDAMSELRLIAPSVLVHGIYDRATSTARAIDGAGAADAEPDPRTMDQLRADVLCDILLTGHATAADSDDHGGDGLGAIRAIVQVSVPVLTLMGEADAAPTLNGRVPIDPDTARILAGAAAIWDRVLTDPISGSVLAVDRRFPTEAQRRYLRARDEHCRFPGCRAAVWRCDVDHTIAVADGGPTCEHNLAHLCRRHHTLKHHTAWSVQQRARGVLVWTSPEGRVYSDKPPPTLRFIARE